MTDPHDQTLPADPSESQSLPPGWVETTLGELNAYKSATVDPAAFPDELFELYSVPIFPTGKPEHQKGSDIGSTKQTVAPDDVLICKINPRINRVWKVNQAGDERQIGSSEWIVFRSPNIHADFYKHFFRSSDFRERLCEDLTGVGGSLTRAQPTRVATFSLPLPPLPEQIRIADKLDTLLARVEAARARLERVPALLGRFRQSVLSAAVSGELTREWRGGGDAEWEEVTVGELLEGKPRNGYSPQGVEHETAVKSLTLSATTTGKFDGSKFKYIDKEVAPDSYLWLKDGDILIQRANSLEYVGVSAVYNGSDNTFIYPDLMMKARASSRAITEYVHYTLLSEPVRAYFRNNATGTAGNMPKINQQTVMTAPAALPPLPEQAEIVRRVEALFSIADRAEARYREALRAFDSLTPSLLQKAFRGELVPQDPNDEPAAVLLERIRAQRAASGDKPKRGRGAGKPKAATEKSGEPSAPKRGRGRPSKIAAATSVEDAIAKLEAQKAAAQHQPTQEGARAEGTRQVSLFED